ncbi:hypothetical protein [Sphingomonas sp.]|uniref:hypothetical protein n=1 Tax=Sphingomonas sp. TaxID=28214 RepID=UPI0035C78CD5
MRTFLLSLLLLPVGPVIAAAQDAPAPSSAAPAAKMTTTDTDIGTLLDNAAAKAVVAKYLPEIVGSDQIDMARSMTLKAIQQYAPDQVTDEKLAKIDAELAKLPAD